jgi:hypothetical protein
LICFFPTRLFGAINDAAPSYFHDNDLLALCCTLTYWTCLSIHKKIKKLNHEPASSTLGRKLPALEMKHQEFNNCSSYPREEYHQCYDEQRDYEYACPSHKRYYK